MVLAIQCWVGGSIVLGSSEVEHHVRESGGRAKLLATGQRQRGGREGGEEYQCPFQGHTSMTPNSVTVTKPLALWEMFIIQTTT